VGYAAWRSTLHVFHAIETNRISATLTRSGEYFIQALKSVVCTHHLNNCAMVAHQSRTGRALFLSESAEAANLSQDSVMHDPVLAKRLLGLIDLTSLNPGDDAESVAALAALASTPAGNVAAVCIWSRFIPVAKAGLRDTGIPIAVVANFPQGADDVAAAARETAAAVLDGADEVDVVFPYTAMLAGNDATGVELVRACRTACGSKALLKVILETGQLGSADNIRRAARLAVAGGAQFLKTSTGKTQPGATLGAAEVLFDVIEEAKANGILVGFKASGGVSTILQAQSYLELYEGRFGAGSATAATFRIGASSLIRPVLSVLNGEA
jgi:deoxyribose-phosphate aldolase